MAGSVKPGEEYEGLDEDQLATVLLRDFDIHPQVILRVLQQVRETGTALVNYENVVYRVTRKHSGYQETHTVVLDPEGTNAREAARMHAQTERHALVAQAIHHHEINVLAEMRRFKAELDDVEKTYRLRLGDE